jgi:hypothetical protein
LTLGIHANDSGTFVPSRKSSFHGQSRASRSS